MKGKPARARVRFRGAACLLAAALVLTAFGSSLALAEKEPAAPQVGLSAPEPSGSSVPAGGEQPAAESGSSAESQASGAAEPQALGTGVSASSGAAGQPGAPGGPSVAGGSTVPPIVPGSAVDGGSAPAGGSGLSSFLSLVASSEALPSVVDDPVSVGQLTVAGGTQGDDWTYSDHVLTIKSSTSLVISGTSTEDRVVVQPGTTANVTLRDIHITRNDKTPAFGMSKATVNLKLEGENSLKGGAGVPGLRTPDATLTIGGPGSLKATGGDSAAGIGGGEGQGSGTVTISGGTVTATGGPYGAGIGGGSQGSSGAVTISSGTVTAIGGTEAAGIGGGWRGTGGTTKILGGTVTATGGNYAPGIGSGDQVTGGDIVISGGTVAAQGGQWGGAGIGGSAAGGGGGIVISGGTVTATSGVGGSTYGRGAGIGAGGKGSGGTFKTTLGDNPGNAFIIATTGISDTSSEKSWSGVILMDNAEEKPDARKATGQVYGSPTLAQNAAIPSYGTLTVPEDKKLTVGDGVTLVNKGVIENHGSIVKAGSGDITGGGTLTSDSGLSLSFSTNPAAYDGAVQLTARVEQTAVTSWGSAVGTGPVTFKLGAQVFGTADLAADGKGAATAVLTMSPKEWRAASWAISDNEVTAAFAGSTGLFPSANASVLNVVKGPQAAPELTASNETILGRGDGAIGGLTTAMEYASSGAGPYAAVTDADTRRTFSVGTYWVRLPGDDKHDPSSAARVDVKAGPKAHVALPDSQVGYSLVVDNPDISWTEVATLSLSLEDGWEKGPDFAVKVNGTQVDLKDGAFTILHPETPKLNVTVEGLVQVFAWTYSTDGMPAGQCSIVGWDGVQPKGGVAVVPGVHDGLKVTGIKGNSSSFSPYVSLAASLDFSDATDLVFVERNAFDHCTSLTGALSIPAAVSIGASAFDHCTSLTSLSLPVATDIGEFAFQGCTNLTSLSLPAVVSVGVDSFDGCTGLTGSLSLPVATTISSDAFHGCSGFTSLSLPAATSIGVQAFRGLGKLSGALSLPDATDIGDSAFYDCTSLASLSLPAVKTIGSSAFKNCTSLSGEFSAPQAASAGSRAFAGCTSLTSLSLPAMTDVGDSAFYGCTGLTSLSLPAMTDVGDSAFYGCTGLVGALSLPSATGIGIQAFQNCSLSSVELGKNLAFLGTQAFMGNHLAHLELPDNPALDVAYDGDGRKGVGAKVMDSQSPDATAYYIPVGTDQGEVELDGLAALGADPARMSSLAVASASTQDPANADWRDKRRARFSLAGLSAGGSQLVYGYDVRRAGGDGRALSTGSASVPLGIGAKYRFVTYRGKGFDGDSDQYSQWVFPGEKPHENVEAGGAFGFDRAGYHAPGGSYDAKRDAGWRTGDGSSGAGAGTPADPADQVAAAGGVYPYYNRWVGNDYSVAFDDNFAHMVALEPHLGVPDSGGGTASVPDPSLVHGSVDGLSALVYGQPAALPDNADPDDSFVMGAFRFEGWATSPDLAESARIEGSNFFSPRTSLTSPTPVTVGGAEKGAPGAGDKIVLYAQWKAQSLADPDQIVSSILIPKNITLVQDGAHLWSKGLDSPAGSNPHAISIATAPDRPGAYWPTDADHVYHVSLVPPDSGGPVLVLTSPLDPNPHVIDVLADPNGPPYDPAPSAASGSPTPLISLQPVTAGRPTPASGVFYLKSEDPAWSFLNNVSYNGVMTFRID